MAGGCHRAGRGPSVRTVCLHGDREVMGFHPEGIGHDGEK